MKLTYLEEHKTLSPLNRANYCRCGNHAPILVRQLAPITEYCYRVECPECGCETPMFPLKKNALAAWRKI